MKKDKQLYKNRSYKNCSLVRKRDRHICQKCGYGELDIRNKNSGLEVHHITPLYKGGDNSPENLILLCMICHKNAPNDKEEFEDFLSFPFPPKFDVVSPCLQFYHYAIMKDVLNMLNIKEDIIYDKDKCNLEHILSLPKSLRVKGKIFIKLIDIDKYIKSILNKSFLPMINMNYEYCKSYKLWKAK